MKTQLELLRECRLQLEYLNGKFGETGTTNSLLSKIDAEISRIDNCTHGNGFDAWDHELQNAYCSICLKYHN